MGATSIIFEKHLWEKDGMHTSTAIIRSPVVECRCILHRALNSIEIW